MTDTHRTEDDVVSVLKSCQTGSNLWKHEFGMAIAEIEALRKDNQTLTNALQRIEAGEPEPCEIATLTLNAPTRRRLYG